MLCIYIYICEPDTQEQCFPAIRAGNVCPQFPSSAVSSFKELSTRIGRLFTVWCIRKSRGCKHVQTSNFQIPSSSLIPSFGWLKECSENS